MKRKLLTLFCFFPLVIGCKEHQEPKKSPEELRQELLAHEGRNPNAYLELVEVTLDPQTKQTRKATLFKKAKFESDGALIEGFVNNKATLATFKDLALKVLYYSKTNSVIKQKNHMLYDYFEPGSTNRFSFKDYPPEGWQSFHVEITNAKWNP